MSSLPHGIPLECEVPAPLAICRQQSLRREMPFVAPSVVFVELVANATRRIQLSRPEAVDEVLAEVRTSRP